MNLDKVQLQTTWNDASGSINTNFEKIRQAILALQAEGGGLDEAELEEFLTSHGYTKEEWVLAQNALLEERIEVLEQGGGAVNVEGSEFVKIDEDGTISLEIDPQGGLGRTEQGLGIVDIPSHLLQDIKIDVDSSMSDTSENAVANKVIKKYVDERAEQAYEQANEYTNEEIASLREELQNGIDHPVFEFEFDSATNKATAEMVSALAEAIADNKLILCNGRTYKFILEQEGMYCLVSDTYLDIMDGKLKASVLAVMSSSYDVQLAEQEVSTGTEITEATIRNWGFTKNVGTITGIKMNDATIGTSGVVDLGNVLTEHQKLKTINGQSIVGEGNITIQGGGATPRVEMTAASAAIEPNKFYVWPMMDSLDLTLGAETSGVMNRYLFQFRNPKAGLTMLTLPDGITWSEDTELDENGLPVMEAAAFYRIEIIEGLASLKKWKLVYINFADAEVERVLMANGVGDGIGITKRDAKAVTNIGTWFKGNTAIRNFAELKEFTNLVSLAESAFEDCENLEHIDLRNVKNLSPYVFYNCVGLSMDVTGLFSDMPTLNYGVFTYAPVHGSLSLPSLREIVNNVSRMQAFSYTKLRRIVSLGAIPAIPSGYNANIPGVFAYITSLDYVRLPNTLTSIGDYAFCGDSNLECIVSEAVTPPSLSSNALQLCGDNFLIYVPDDAVEAYKAATNWNGYASRIKGLSEKAGLHIMPFRENIYMENSLKLTALLDLTPVAASFRVVSGDATIEGDSLIFNGEGAVQVEATYNGMTSVKTYEYVNSYPILHGYELNRYAQAVESPNMSIVGFVPLNGTRAVKWGSTGGSIGILCEYDATGKSVDYWGATSNPRSVTLSTKSTQVKATFLTSNLDNSYIYDNTNGIYLWKGKNVQ